MPNLESPSTYAEWYWKNSLDASMARSEGAEKAYAPVISNILAASGISEFIPASLQPFYALLASPTAPDWDDAQRMFLGTVSRAVNLVAGEEMARPFQYEAAEKLLTLRMDAETATILQQRKKITDDLYFGRMHSAGYADSEITHYYNSRLPYPAFADIITWARYHGDPYNPKELSWSKLQVSPEDWDLWEWLSRQKLNTEQVLSLYRRDTWDISRTDDELSRLGWRQEDILPLHNLAYDVPNSMLLVQGALMQGKSGQDIAQLISKGGIHPEFSELYYEGVLTKPATEDIIAYELRRDPSLNNLSNELTKTGTHPAYHNLYKELAYQIPPVADIITMAVREAFTPAIAARFGQYEDLPTDFVTWVGKKGLSKEWAERYWAAHWSLPSPQQGFEMLHRGIINRDDLFMLLRALDIMPFWRDKLVNMAYTLFTRIDIRRMYNIGVMNEGDVNRAYRELGYDDYKADIMTRFVVKLKEQADKRIKDAAIKAELAKQEAEAKAAEKKQEAAIKAGIVKPATWTNAQTLSFLKKKLIATERAEQELELLGYNKERINVYLASVKPAP